MARTPTFPRYCGPDPENALQQWMDAISAIHNPIFIHDREFRIVRANLAYEACAGMPAGEFAGRHYWEIFPKGNGPLPGCLKSINDLKGEEQSDEVATDDGRIYLSRASAMVGEHGEYLYSVHIMEDITERRHAEEELRLAAQVFNATDQSIIILDTDKNVIDVNQAFTRITAFAQDEAIGRKPWQIGNLLEQSFLDPVWESLQSQDHWRGETHKQFKNGETYAAMLSVSAARDEQGRIVNYIMVFSDISELKTSQEYFEYLANHDLLTGLPNRNLFYDRLQHSLEKAVRSKERLAVLFIDLDNFKTVNDTFGHEYGDMLLLQVAERLHACVRKEDTIARLGGDEFTILVEDIHEPEYVVSGTALRIIDMLSQPFMLEAHDAHISASIGIAFYPDNGADMTTLLKNADSAMYQAKQSGKNNFQFFTEDINAGAQLRARLERDLRRAITGRELQLVYQPKIDLNSGVIMGVEALLRWQHPELGLIQPQQFIPVAETSGLIFQLSEWVMHQVCRQAREWADQHLTFFRVGFNLLARELLRKDLTDAIRHAVKTSGCDPAMLEVELPEIVMMDDTSRTADILRQLKDLGMQIAIDDFGIGHSSLNGLRRFPIDQLKIGRHYVSEVTRDGDSAAIVATIIAMGHSLQMKVIAEGVENRQQLEFLKQHGCDQAQGFYLCPPLPASHLTEILAKQLEGETRLSA